MPNIYYSSPSVPFASATQGFLSSLQDFKKLDLAQQGVDQRGQALEQEAGAESRRNRQLDIQEENALTRQARLQLDIAMQEQAFAAKQQMLSAFDTLGGEAVSLGVLDEKKLERLRMQMVAGKAGLDDLESVVGEESQKLAENVTFKQGWMNAFAEADALLAAPESGADEDPPSVVQAKKDMRLLRTRLELDPFLQVKTTPEEFLRQVQAAIEPPKEQGMLLAPGVWENIQQMLDARDAPDAVKEQLEVLDLDALRSGIEK